MSDGVEEIVLVQKSIKKICKILTPQQLQVLANLMEQRQEDGFGEIKMVWWRGKLDVVYDSDRISFTRLPRP